MKVVETVSEMQGTSTCWRQKSLKVGVVPTMGALHAGHLSLIDEIRPFVDRIVVTLFVNPTQFGENEDIGRYPRTFEADKAACENKGVDALFFPSNEEMYGSTASTWVTEDSISQDYCGTGRPGHFRGVTTVVTKLFNVVLPDVAIFGEKDFQQLQVLRRMTRDLHFPIKILGGPIIREKSGLAMSSRNEYLEPLMRKSAGIIFQSMNEASEKVKMGLFDLSQAKEYIRKQIASVGGEPAYIEVVDKETLEPISCPDAESRCLVAALFGSTRLLDNIDFS